MPMAPTRRMCCGTFEGMRKLLFTAVLFPGAVLAQPPAGYYDAAQGLSGEPLRVALRGIISGHSVVPNGSLWSAFFIVDRKPDNTVWDIYSDVPGGPQPYTFSFSTDQCGEYSDEGDCFNREHTFPQSWFGGNTGAMDTDLFHLYPTDAMVNQRRGNWPYGEVGSATWTSENGSKLGPCNYPGCSETVFEPIDAYKGDVARNYFYLLTRYYGSTNGWTAPILQNGDFRPWVEDLLMDWHEQDPVSAKEVARNNSIFSSFQSNRNPYIDYPEWVEQIWGPTASVQESVVDPIHVWLAGDQLRVERNNYDPVQLEVLDARGALLQRHLIATPSATLAMDLSEGLYVVVLDGPNGRHVQRIVR